MLLHRSVAQDPDIEIVAGIDMYDGIKNDVSGICKPCRNVTVDADVVIDFSNAKAVDDTGRLLCGEADSGCIVHDRTF